MYTVFCITVLTVKIGALYLSTSFGLHQSPRLDYHAKDEGQCREFWYMHMYVSSEPPQTSEF
jgi:hypothetical protein